METPSVSVCFFPSIFFMFNVGFVSIKIKGLDTGLLYGGSRCVLP